MLSPISNERSYLPTLKRQKLEETIYDDDRRSDYSCDSGNDEEALELFNQEIRKSQGFEMDFSKFRCTFGWIQLDLDDSTIVDEPQTNRDLMVMLAKQALSQRSAEQEKCLEVCKILRANFYQSAGLTFYISFLVKDPSDGNQTKPYRAVVYQHFAGYIRVRSCNPKPPSSSSSSSS